MALEGFARGRGGAVHVVQRTSSDLKLAPHWHLVALDGVYVESSRGELVFHALPHLSTDEVADVLQTVRVRITGLLGRRGLLEGHAADGGVRADETLAEREPLLAALATTAVGSSPPAGPERRRGLVGLALPGRPGSTVSASRCVAEHGFSLHAATRAGAHDERGREALVRYVLRPPLATERLTVLADDLVRIELKRAFADGTVAVELDPLSLLWRLCAAVPPPRRHTVLYSGVLSSHAQWRSRIVPTVAHAAPGTSADGSVLARDTPSRATPTRPRRWRPRPELLFLSFGLDVEHCPHCGGKLHLHALVHHPASIARILRHRGEPTEPLPLSPARGPPYWKSQVLRRRPTAQAAEPPDPQRDLFHA
jgi:hypothetical protein